MELSTNSLILLEEQNTDMSSRPYFEVPISLNIIERIISTTLKFIKNTRHEVIK